MRRALSSVSRFLGFMYLGLGFVMSLLLLPSLRDQGSGVTEEEWIGILGFFEGGFGQGRSGVVVKRKEDFRESIFTSYLQILFLCLVRGKVVLFFFLFFLRES